MTFLRPLTENKYLGKKVGTGETSNVCNVDLHDIHTKVTMFVKVPFGIISHTALALLLE